MVMPRSRSSGALSMVSNERNVFFGLCFERTFVIAAVSVVLPWSMCPIVPTFTCGLDRSNFSLPIVSSSLSSRSMPAIQNQTRSVVGVQLIKTRPQFGCDLLQAGQVELADLALVAIAQAAILAGRCRTQQAFAEYQFEVADAQPSSLNRLQKLLDPGWGKRTLNGCPDRAERLRIGHRDQCLFMQSAQPVTPASRPFNNHRERETGIEPATNSLEGCDSTTELLPPVTLSGAEAPGLDRKSTRLNSSHANI